MLKKINIIVIGLFIALSSSFITKAQLAGINFSVAVPQGEFGRQVDNLGYGISGEFLFLSPKSGSPVGLGLDFGYYIYGRETRKEPWSLTIPDVFVDVERTNNLLNFHFVLELGLPSGRIRPYIQSFVGGTYLFTQTSVKGEYNNDEIASSTNYYDWAWSYGAGGGVSILLTGDPISELAAIYLDLKGRYLFGTEADYLKEGGVDINGSQVTYRPSKSKTDLLTLHLGIRAALNF